MRSLFHSQTRRLSLPGLSEAAVGTQIVRYLFILRIIFLNFIVNDKIFPPVRLNFHEESEQGYKNLV